MADRRKKRKDIGKIIFRLIALEVLVIVGFIAYLTVRFLPTAISAIRGTTAPTAVQSIVDPNNISGQTAASTAAVTEAQPSVEEKVQSTVSLAAVGDNLMARSSTMSGLQADGTYSYYTNFCNIQDLVSSADLAVISQDTVMAGTSYGTTSGNLYTTGTEVGEALVNAGFNVVLAANDHILDMGKDGLENMMQYWETYYPGVELLGINDSQADHDSPVYLERNGITFALINYTWSVNGTGGESYLVNVSDEDWLKSMAIQASEHADFVIAFPHWGTADSLEADAAQQAEAAQLADLGVDLIIGNGPGVVEPAVWLTTESGQKALVYYSLGNVQSIEDTMENMLGGLASVTITKTNLRTYISKCSLDFVVTHYTKTSNSTADYFDLVTTFPWKEYDADLAAQHGILAWDADFSYDNLDALRKDILSRCSLNQ